VKLYEQFYKSDIIIGKFALTSSLSPGFETGNRARRRQ